MISYNGDGSYRIYPKCSSSYSWDWNEERRFQKKMLRIIKRKRLPKSLEISWLEHLLEIVKEKPEHEYSKKYDQFQSEHPLFF